jgi:hypothetical protein
MVVEEACGIADISCWNRLLGGSSSVGDAGAVDRTASGFMWASVRSPRP